MHTLYENHFYIVHIENRKLQILDQINVRIWNLEKTYFLEECFSFLGEKNLAEKRKIIVAFSI